MASPTLTLEIAFATDPGSTPTWTDVSAYLKSFSTRRGRQNELDRFEAGSAEILLDNADRRFDPTYTSGAFYGNIKPMKKVRLSADRAGLALALTAASSQYLSLTDNSSISVGDIDFTYAIWIYPTSVVATTRVLGQWASAAGDLSFVLTQLSNALRFTVSADGSAAVNVDATPTLSANTWYFVVVWHDASANTINIQINNGTADSVAHSTGVRDSSLKFIVGARGDGEDQFFGGRIDQAAFFKRVLTSTERGEMYASGYGMRYSQLTPAHRVSLISWWELEESTGSRLDAHGTNHLTPQNGPTNAAGITHRYRLFTGFIESWPQRWPLKLATAVVPIHATDGFKALNLVPLSTSYSSELSSTRITNVLDTASWLAADRLISTGQTTLQASTLASVSALQHLQDVAQSENGRLFIDGSGRLVFQDRHTPLKPPYDVSQATYGDAAGELDYTELTLSFDDSVLYTDVRVTRTGGAEQIASSAAAIATYLRRSISKTGLLMTTDSEAESAAYYLFGRYSIVGVRIEAITISPERDATTQYPQVLGREIGDRITIKRRPPGGGNVLTQDAIIEGIEHTADISGFWKTVWRLSPAEASAYWQVESATNSVLNSTTKVAY